MNRRCHQTSSALTGCGMRNRCLALTLVETAAVVVALCAVLAVIVPALGETRRRGKDMVCIQNLHRIIHATSIYSGRDPTEAALPASKIEDPNSYAFDNPHFSQLPVYAYGGKSGLGVFNGTLNILTSQYGPIFDMASADRPLNYILYRGDFPQLDARPGSGGTKWLSDTKHEMGIYSCPSDSGYTGLDYDFALAQSKATAFTFYGTSYAANIFWINDTSAGFARLASNSPYLRPLSRVPNPARTIAYMESNGRFGWYAKPDPCPFGFPALSGECLGWHGKPWTFNAAFMDGSANAIYMRGYRSEPISRSPYPGPFNIACITIRGDGWQIDTLPSAPVLTAHNSPNSTGRIVP